MTTTTTDLPMLIEEVECVSVERVSPSFVRVELGSPALAELDRNDRSYDQRVKLIFADGDHPLPSFAGADDSWYATWMTKPLSERGHMRTYTVREVRGEGVDTRLVVDFIVHDGDCGPGGTWGARARVGDRLVLMAPRRGYLYGGIEFVPGDASRLLLVGDETAVPAIAAILEQLDVGAQGAAFLEVPFSDDVLTLQHPPGISVHWVPRDGAPRGEALDVAVLGYLGAGPVDLDVSDDEVDPDLWETPTHSSSGEDVAEHAGPVGHDWDGLYAWIAGESKIVTGLRRALVKDLGIDRHQVAFMGYWRHGVAMRS
ncbi:siderophore-interacting protein [Nocardioides dongxiaopingii]|uniref:siderophore-interacting protein n=1 Tax=Nocardioides TaxID=1839 RepID=UPI0010C7627A|nr:MULTISPECIES: siderophore-interacting protein [Nocardioides]QCW52098.2 siderophore-interacting protein [Nocardioides sp. S-1144]